MQKTQKPDILAHTYLFLTSRAFSLAHTEEPSRSVSLSASQEVRSQRAAPKASGTCSQVH